MTKFEYVAEEYANTGIKNITMVVSDEASLDEMCEAFQGFLLSTGYVLPENSSVQIVENEV